MFLALHHAGQCIVVGLTTRTNKSGAESLQKVFPEYPVIPVDLNMLHTAAANIVPTTVGANKDNVTAAVEQALHLKSFCSMCTKATILVGGVMGRALQNYLQTLPAFANHSFLHVPDMAAANCVLVNDTLIRRSRKEFPHSDAIFRAQIPGHIRQVEVEAGELAKVDGALTCCSLLL